MRVPISTARFLEPLEAVGDLWSAVAFVCELSHEQREGLDVACDPKTAGIDGIEADIANQSGHDALCGRVVAAIDEAGPLRFPPRREHAKERFARYGAERR